MDTTSLGKGGKDPLIKGQTGEGRRRKLSFIDRILLHGQRELILALPNLRGFQRETYFRQPSSREQEPTPHP